MSFVSNAAIARHEYHSYSMPQVPPVSTEERQREIVFLRQVYQVSYTVRHVELSRSCPLVVRSPSTFQVLVLGLSVDADAGVGVVNSVDVLCFALSRRRDHLFVVRGVVGH